MSDVTLPGRPGRPTKLTDEIEAAVLTSIRVGTSEATACGCAGIDEATHYRWKAQGRQALAKGNKASRFARYCEKIDAARSAFILRQTSLIQEAARGVPYETTRTVRKEEIVGTNADGSPHIVTTTTTTVERGEKRDWRASERLLKWRAPGEHRDELLVETRLSPEQEAVLLERAVEAMLAELGVDTSKRAVGEVVARHLHAVADEAEEMSG